MLAVSLLVTQDPGDALGHRKHQNTGTIQLLKATNESKHRVIDTL